MTRIGIQNLGSHVLDNPHTVTADSINVEPIGLDGDGGDFLSLGIKWSDGHASEYAIEVPAANELVSMLVRALLKLPPHHATITLADLTAVRIDVGAATVSVDGTSGTSDTLGTPFPFPDWQLVDRRDHMLGDFSCDGTSGCAACQAELIVVPDSDAPPCTDCGKLLPLDVPAYAVDSGGVCETCALARYGDRAPEYLIA